MKKKYLSILALFAILFSINAQTCPASIQASQSSSTAVRFKIASGSCNTYPSAITIDGSTFTQSSCSGTNLNYAIDSGQTPIDENNFTADFGGGAECTYVGSVLGLAELGLLNEEISIYPNPIGENEFLEINLTENTDVNISIYNLLGKVVLTKSTNNSKSVIIDLENLNSGIYLLKINVDNKIITKKIVVK
jgi:hypothetical protein